jgi:hypothetical protein
VTTYLVVMQGARNGEGLRTHLVQAEEPKAAVMAAFGSAAKALTWEPIASREGYRVFAVGTEAMTEGIVLRVELG